MSRCQTPPSRTTRCSAGRPDGFATYRQRLDGIVTAEERTLLRFNAALSFRAAPAP